MRCVPIKARSVEEALPLIQHAKEVASLIELRLDYFSHIDLHALQNLPKNCSFIFTLRKASEGGAYTQSEEERQKQLLQLAALKPEYLDVEASLPKSFISHIASTHPTTKLILSYHNFSHMPQDLSLLLQEMSHPAAHFYKIALHASSTSETLRLLNWAHLQKLPLIPIALGPFGSLSRILTPLTYAPLIPEQETAPGQIPISHLPALSSFTHLLGLIGCPIDKSISDETHNALIQTRRLDAFYTKMDVTLEDLPAFLKEARNLPFLGLSVTMPLKEAILSYLDAIDPEASQIQAVNTLLFSSGKITGFNTDGIGALNVLEKQIPVNGKHIAILGSGGSGKAIAHEAKKRGASTTFFSRYPEKSPLLKKSLGELAQEKYDILINCTPLPLPIDPSHIRPQSVVMDINTRPHLTPLLEQALLRKCPIIEGHEMFIEQALYQFKIWFQEDVDLLRPLLTKIILDSRASKVPSSEGQ